MNWQPIETAPKDGSDVLLTEEGWVFIGWYSDLPGDDGWFKGDDSVNPTHWMPLPEPPKQ